MCVVLLQQNSERDCGVFAIEFCSAPMSRVLAGYVGHSSKEHETSAELRHGAAPAK